MAVRVENIVGKGENAGYQHFLLFQQCFSNCSSVGTSNVDMMCKRVEHQICLFYDWKQCWKRRKCWLLALYPFLTILSWPYSSGLLAHLSMECSVSYCDCSSSVSVRPSIRPQFSCEHCSIYKHQPISTKLGQSVYYYKILNDFDYGTNQTRTV